MKARIINLVFFFALLSQSLFAQLSVNSHYPARKSGFWSLGINGGSAYQSADVARLYEGWGAGLTLGKNLYYRPGATFSFDLRGRLLYDESYGLDSKRSYGIKANNSVNGVFDQEINYLKPAGNGYVFANHKTQMGELGLEGVLTFNKLREKTGIVASVYGGVGLTVFGVSTDQEHFGAKGYETYQSLYAGIDTNATKSTIRQQLRNTLDGNYETFGDGKEDLQVGIMPSLGFELGYQFAPRFHASIGHRLTYSLRDNLDGQQWNNANQATGNNDRSHYTYLKMEWELTPINKCYAPKIEITSPDRNPYSTDQATVRVSAKIENIRNSLDVQYRVNGEEQEFDFYNPRVTKIVTLRPGQNEVEITATNDCGKDIEKVIITYIPPKTETPKSQEPPTNWGQPPIVETKEVGPIIRVTKPNNSPYTTDNESFTINATIINVNSDRNVGFKQNGSERSFTFSATRGTFTSSVALQEGKNVFEIQARNNTGVANGEVVVYYEIKDVFPTIAISEPTSEYTETYEEYRTIRAYSSNINEKNQITFLVNNRRTTDFSFNTMNGEITKNLALNEGKNLVRIEVRNNRGNAADETTIVRKRDIVPPSRTIQAPIVRITTPSQNRSTTYDNNETIRATIQYVENQSDITFTVNGRRNSNFNFNRGNFTASVNLEKGNNTFTIRARNSDGEDEKSITIVKEERYVPPVVSRPEVTISSPRNGATFDINTCQLDAYTKNVGSKNEITVTLNGSSIEFIYSPMSKKITANMVLIEGSNTIRISAKNEGGSDEASSSVTFKKTIIVETPRKPRTPRQEDKVETELPEVKTPGRTPRTEILAKPTVEIVSLTQNVGSPRDPATGACSLAATVTFVTEKSDITVLLNGQSVDFQFDSAAKTINSAFQLKEGANMVVVKVKNKIGNAEAQRAITF